LAEVKDFEEGEKFAEWNQPSDNLYLIINGSASVLDSDNHKVAELTDHQFINSREFLNFLHPSNEKGQTSAYIDFSVAERLKNILFWKSESLEKKLLPHTESHSTVVASKKCHVFSWDFQKLKNYLKYHSSEESAIQISISADLTKKLEQSRNPLIRYRELLISVASGDEILPIEKAKLNRYRETHSITREEHERMLEEYGWSKIDYSNGYRKSDISGNFSEYEKIIGKELSGGQITETGKSILRKVRKKLGIDPQKHLLALKKLGWSYEDFELGYKEINPNSEALVKGELGREEKMVIDNLKHRTSIVSLLQ